MRGIQGVPSPRAGGGRLPAAFRENFHWRKTMNPVSLIVRHYTLRKNAQGWETASEPMCQAVPLSGASHSLFAYYHS